MRIAIPPPVIFALCLLFCSASAIAQPAAYRPRGVHAYLVNYGAINGDRHLAELAARRFVLIDEGSAADIRRMSAVNPALPILQYKDLVALYDRMPEYPVVNRDEQAFMHACEPSGLAIAVRGDSATLAWLPDRRDTLTRGYRLLLMLDSLGTRQRLVDSVIHETRHSVRLPKSAVFLAVASVLEDGTERQYGLPVPNPGDTRGRPVVAVRDITVSRTPTQIRFTAAIESLGDVDPDSVTALCDINLNNVLDGRTERITTVRNGGRWMLDCSAAVTPEDFGGVEFVVDAWHTGKPERTPAGGAYSTIINNRITNNSYGFFVMNPGSFIWRKAYNDQVLGYFTKYGYTGLFEDDTWYKISSWSTDVMTPHAYNDVAWKQAVFTMLDSIRIAIAPRPAYFNGLFAGASDSLLAHADGGMTEGFAYTHWSGHVTDAYWRELCDVGLRAQHRFHKIWLALGGAPFDDPGARLYVYASYMLLDDSLGMLANATDYSEFSHFPEFDIPLGTPQRTADSTVDELRRIDAGGAPYHVREFTHGTVVVNAGRTRTVITDGWKGWPMLRLTPGTTVDGGRIETIAGSDTIPPFHARVYLDPAAGGGLWSPEIDSIVVTPAPMPADGVTEVRLRCLAHDRSAAVFHADATKPLWITADLGPLGGAKDLALYNDGAPASAGPSWYEARCTIPVGALNADTGIRFSAFSTTGLMAMQSRRLRVVSADSTNLVMNYSFEIDNDENTVPDLWTPYMKGFTYDTLGVNAVSGRRSIHVVNDSATDARGVYARVVLNQTAPHDLVLSGYSKAVDVSGVRNNDYSMYIDIRYQDGTPLYGQTATFSTGTHDWEYAEKVIHPLKPVQSLSLYALFRNHTGSAWFDHIALRPYDGPSVVDSPMAPDAGHLQITPNPARGVIAICSRTQMAPQHVTITDLTGREVVHRPCSHTAEGLVHVDITALAPGSYLVRLVGEHGVETGRFIRRP